MRVSFNKGRGRERVLLRERMAYNTWVTSFLVSFMERALRNTLTNHNTRVNLSTLNVMVTEYKNTLQVAHKSN